MYTYTITTAQVGAKETHAFAVNGLQWQGNALTMFPGTLKWDNGVEITITQTTVTDQHGNDMAGQVDPKQVAAYRAEMRLRSQVPAALSRIGWALAFLMLCMGVVVAFLNLTDAKTVKAIGETIQPALTFLNVLLVGMLGGVALFLLWQAILHCTAFYAPVLHIEKDADGFHFALNSRRVPAGEIPAFAVDGREREYLSRLVAPFRLVACLPGENKDDYFSLLSQVEREINYEQGYVVLPMQGDAEGIIVLPGSGQRRSFNLNADPINGHGWRFENMENADGPTYVKCVTETCKRIHQSRVSLIGEGGSDPLTAMHQRARMLATVLILFFAAPAFSQDATLEAVKALPGASAYVPDAGQSVVFLFGKGSLKNYGDGVRNVPSLLVGIRGYTPQDRGAVKGVVIADGTNVLRKFTPAPMPGESARRLDAIVPADRFAFDDSLRNVQAAIDAANRIDRTIKQFGSNGGPMGYIYSISRVAWPVIFLLSGLFWFWSRTSTSEITFFAYAKSAFTAISEWSRLGLWSILVFMFSLVTVIFFFYMLENGYTWVDAIMQCIQIAVCTSLTKKLVVNPTHTQQTAGRGARREVTPYDR